MSDDFSVRNDAVTSDERIRNVLRRHIRIGIERREFTRDSLAKLSQVNIHQIDGILTRDPAKHRRIATEDALCLAATIGDDCVQALIGLIHYTAHRTDPDSIPVGEIVAAGLKQFTIIADAAADGRIDHHERPLCREAADRLIATVMPLSSAGDAE